MIDDLEEMIREFEATGKFVPREFEIDSASQQRIVKMKGNPQRFTPSIFDGEWAEVGQYPDLASARVLRVLAGPDGVSRAIMRQGRALFVYPLV